MAKLDLSSYLSRLTTNADVLNVFEMRNNPLDRKHFVRLTYQYVGQGRYAAARIYRETDNMSGSA